MTIAEYIEQQLEESGLHEPEDLLGKTVEIVDDLMTEYLDHLVTQAGFPGSKR